MQENNIEEQITDMLCSEESVTTGRRLRNTVEKLDKAVAEAFYAEFILSSVKEELPLSPGSESEWDSGVNRSIVKYVECAPEEGMWHVDVLGGGKLYKGAKLPVTCKKTVSAVQKFDLIDEPFDVSDLVDAVLEQALTLAEELNDRINALGSEDATENWAVPYAKCFVGDGPRVTLSIEGQYVSVMTLVSLGVGLINVPRDLIIFPASNTEYES